MKSVFSVLFTIVLVAVAVADAQSATTSGKSGRLIEEYVASDSNTDQAIIPTEHEVVAFAMPGTGWLVGFQDIQKVKTIIEFVPAGHTIKDWKEVVSLQTFLVQPDVAPSEFADQIASHWKGNCKSVQSSVVRKWSRDGFDAVLGVTDCAEASYSLVPEYMMYLIVRGKTRLHLIQRSIRGKDYKVDYDRWIKFFDTVNICPKEAGKEVKCLPKASLSVLEQTEEDRTNDESKTK